jgi:phosphoglycerate transport regulatory protein PgtC
MGNFRAFLPLTLYKKRKKSSAKVPPRQAEIEEKWDAFTKKNYAEAKEKAEKAFALVK